MNEYNELSSLELRSTDENECGTEVKHSVWEDFSLCLHWPLCTSIFSKSFYMFRPFFKIQQRRSSNSESYKILKKKDRFAAIPRRPETQVKNSEYRRKINYPTVCLKSVDGNAQIFLLNFWTMKWLIQTLIAPTANPLRSNLSPNTRSKSTQWASNRSLTSMIHCSTCGKQFSDHFWPSIETVSLINLVKKCQ